jgi:Spy/CpxP family protein refolding chaperone
MIHVGVRHEGMAHAQKLARRQRRQIAEVEQQRGRPKRKLMNSPGSENGSLTRLG